jgi:signal transduction histidine kinase
MAFVLAVIAAFHALLWRRSREAGTGWFAVGMGCMAMLAATAELHSTEGPFLNWSLAQPVLAIGLAALAVGLVEYLQVPASSRRLALTATLLPTTVFAVVSACIGLTGAHLPRSLGQLPVALSFLAMGLLAVWGAWHERDVGHAAVAVALLTIPVAAVLIALSKADAVSLRLFAFPPLLALGLMLIPASLLRRSRALQQEVQRRLAAEAELSRLNQSLEKKVVERTADLHELAAGLESFNRSVSHDLRGALGGIAGLAQLADDGLRRGDDQLARRALPTIIKQAEQSSRLMNALLSLARVGDAPFESVAVALNPLVAGVVEQLALARPGQAMPRIDVAPLPTVQADPELLKPVFANLIGNAIKFTSAGEAGCVEVGAEATAAGVTVFVRDNGIGFDDEAAARLFTPFVRLNPQSSDGHGIGLSIVRRAVERHGGRVWAEGRPGAGAVFRFSLPA